MLYPIQTESRALMDLSGIWDFQLDNGHAFDEGWTGRPLPAPDTMAVPSSYNDLKESMGHKEHYGWAFYQRRFAVPAILRGQRLVLRMAAVTHTAKVYLNGQLVCQHKGGFLPFEAEVNSYLQEGENLLTIAVDNRIDHSTLPVGGENGQSMLGGNVAANAKPRNLPNFDFFYFFFFTGTL